MGINKFHAIMDPKLGLYLHIVQDGENLFGEINLTPNMTGGLPCSMHNLAINIRLSETQANSAAIFSAEASYILRLKISQHPLLLLPCSTASSISQTPQHGL